MKEVALQLITYYEEQEKIAKRFVLLRKRNKISQKRMAKISDVSYASIRRFEKTGDISFASFVKLALALRKYDELDNLFKTEWKYESIEDVIKANHSKY